MAPNEELLLLKSTKQDLVWFNNNYSKLERNYKNQFIAIKDSQTIAASSNFDSLIDELKNKGIDPVRTLIKYVTDAYTIL